MKGSETRDMNDVSYYSIQPVATWELSYFGTEKMVQNGLFHTLQYVIMATCFIIFVTETLLQFKLIIIIQK